jgi:FixJ family two-component response regulator
VKDYADLLAYRRSFQLGKEIFETTKHFPKEEIDALTDQFRRAIRSLGANIAEAWGKRRYKKHFISKLTDAHAELLTDMAEPEPMVFVVDDDPSVCRSIERLIEPAGFKVQSFRSAAQFLAQGRPSSPACLVLDVQLPGLSGLDLQRELTNSGIQLPIIFITGHGDIPMSVRAMKGGAVEFLTKPFRGAQLLSAIRAALERDRTMLQQRIEVTQLHNRYNLLTAREREVLALLVSGLLNKQVAGELATTERTIKFHRANIMRKMQAASVADLVKMAQKLGLGG